MPWTRSLVAVGNVAPCYQNREFAVLTAIQDDTQRTASCCARARARLPAAGIPTARGRQRRAFTTGAAAPLFSSAAKATRRVRLAPDDRGVTARKSAFGWISWRRQQDARSVALHTGVLTPQSGPVANTGAFDPHACSAIRGTVAWG